MGGVGCFAGYDVEVPGVEEAALGAVLKVTEVGEGVCGEVGVEELVEHGGAIGACCDGAHAETFIEVGVPDCDLGKGLGGRGIFWFGGGCGAGCCE